MSQQSRSVAKGIPSHVPVHGRVSRTLICDAFPWISLVDVIPRAQHALETLELDVRFNHGETIEGSTRMLPG